MSNLSNLEQKYIMSDTNLSRHNNISFIDYEQYIALNEYMKVLCSDRGTSAYISNAISNIGYNGNKEHIDDLLRKILAEICPEKITDILKLFDAKPPKLIAKTPDTVKASARDNVPVVV